MADTDIEEAKAPKASKAKTVAMTRDADQHEAPHSADVHPDEVEAWKAGGWTVAD